MRIQSKSTKLYILIKKFYVNLCGNKRSTGMYKNTSILKKVQYFF